MTREECHFFLHGGLDGNLVLDVLLRAILDANEAETQLNLLVHDRTLGIGTAVHDVDLGDDTDSTDTFGVNVSRHAETLLHSHICIG